LLNVGLTLVWVRRWIL